jgi:hypothetical protein
MADDTDPPEVELVPLECDSARGRRLGTGFIPRPQPKPESPKDYDPLTRFAEEMSWSTD